MIKEKIGIAAANIQCQSNTCIAAHAAIIDAATGATKSTIAAANARAEDNDVHVSNPAPKQKTCTSMNAAKANRAETRTRVDDVIKAIPVASAQRLIDMRRLWTGENSVIIRYQFG